MDGDRGPQLEAVILSFLGLCTIAVSLRTYTMGFILKRFFLEDYLAILALVRNYPVTELSTQWPEVQAHGLVSMNLLTNRETVDLCGIHVSCAGQHQIRAGKTPSRRRASRPTPCKQILLSCGDCLHRPILSC